jgi:hypothetical protein
MRAEEWRKELIDRIDKAGDFLTAEDGFVYYCPSGQGFLGSDQLIAIADELTRRNKEWDDAIEMYFEWEGKLNLEGESDVIF